MKGRLLKGTLTVLGAVALSTIGIFASDALQGIAPGIGNIGNVGSSGTCKEGSVPLRVDGNLICVDVFEVSASKGCPHGSPVNTVETERNINTAGCYGASVPDARPWTYISLPQAQRVCSGAGKRLPTAEEWYRIALGTKPDECAVKESGAQMTKEGRCVSDIGVHDAVGNVWEWVDETVVNGMYDDRPLPAEGYVASVDADGIAVTSGATGEELYGNDYVWTDAEGVLGMIRGGFYSSAEDAGLYTVNAAVPTSFATQGIGFRCVEDVL